jgi:hypothetical protein
VCKEAAGTGIRFLDKRLDIGHGEPSQADGFGVVRSASPGAARRGSKRAAGLAGFSCGVPPGATPDVRAAVFHASNLQLDRWRHNDFIRRPPPPANKPPARVAGGRH